MTKIKEIGFFAFMLSFLLRPAVVGATWTPLITSGDFTGLQTDLLTLSAGIVSLLIIVLAVGILWKVLS